MKITSKITMDLQKSGVCPVLCAVQDDRYSRELEITLTDGGRKWPLPEGSAVVVRFRKSDGKGGEYDTLPDGSPAWQAESNRLRIALAPQVLTMPGTVNLTVSVMRGDSRISTFRIPLQVEGISKGSGLDSEDYSHVTGFLPVPEKALPGQALQVAAVDERGRVTQVEAVDAAGMDALFDRQEITVPAYTNLVPLSTDAQGGIFNGCGWMENKMLDSDGSVIDNAGGACVSGFIPVKPGDVIRIQDPSRVNFSTTVHFCLYNEEKAIQTGIGKNYPQIQTSAEEFGTLTVEGNTVTWTLEPMNYWHWRNFAWLRVTTFSADMVVTVNEPLTETRKEQYVLKPGVKVTGGSLENGGMSLSGKTIVGFGDSILAYVRDDSSVLSLLAAQTGATVHNAAFGGCRMATHPAEGYAAFSMWTLAKAIAEGDWSAQDAQAAAGPSYFPEQLARLKGIDFRNVDMVLIHYGTNDFAAGSPGVAIDNPDNPTDCATLCGAFRYSVETLLTVHPHLQLFVSLPTYRYWPDTGEFPETYTNSLGKQIREYIDALRAVAAEYNLPVIDCWSGLGANRWNASALLADGVHHNAAGRRRLGEFLAAHVSGRQNSGMDGTSVRALIDAAIGNAIGGSY